MACPRCDDLGWLECGTGDGARCWLEPCDCPAGEDWAERAARAAERAQDAHERAAARARADDFTATAGRDWT